MDDKTLGFYDKFSVYPVGSDHRFTRDTFILRVGDPLADKVLTRLAEHVGATVDQLVGQSTNRFHVVRNSNGEVLDRFYVVVPGEDHAAWTLREYAKEALAAGYVPLSDDLEAWATRIEGQHGA